MHALAAADILIPTRGGDLPAYYAAPPGPGPFPIVLLGPEIFAVNENMRDIARRFAALGYCAIAPDFFFRQGDVSHMTDHQRIFADVIAKVPDAQVVADLEAAAAHAAARLHGDARRLGMTGFCWGGRQTWLYAAHSHALRAGVAWYGRLQGAADSLHPRSPLDAAPDLNCPMLGLYGGQDKGIPLESVERMRAALAAANKTAAIVVYPDAGHGFFADFRPSYHPASAADAWQRTVAWFARYLS